MKHRVSELEGDLLNAAVAKIEHWYRTSDLVINGLPVGCEAWWHPGFGDPANPPKGAHAGFHPGYFSSNWDAAGEIIDRERIMLIPQDRAGWTAKIGAEWMGSEIVDCQITESGATPLVAAMRAYVSSKLGKEVELP